MADTRVDSIREILEDLVMLLVDFPDEVKVEIAGTADTVVFTLKVHDDDIGKVIGRQGVVAHSLRTLVISCCGRLKKQAILEIPAKPKDGVERGK